VTADENRRIEVFERELWRIAVEHLDYGEQVQWAALAGARVAPTGWRRARAMLHFDQGGELKRTFLTTAVERNKNPQLRLKALQEISAGRDAEAFDRALDFVETWPRDDKREGVKVVLQALAEKKIGRRDQANNWIWRCANMTREVHEEYAVQRWPETKRLLGLLVNSSGGAHARNARRLVHAARQQDRRLAAALLAAALPHTAEAGEVINGARTRMSRKPAALARELLRNFPKGRGKSKRRRRKKTGAGEAAAPEAAIVATEVTTTTDGESAATDSSATGTPPKPRRTRSRRKAVSTDPDTGAPAAADVPAAADSPAADAESRAAAPGSPPKPARTRSRRKPAAAATDASAPAEAAAESPPAEAAPKPKPKPARSRRKPAAAEADSPPAEEAPKPTRSRRKPAAAAATAKPRARRTPAKKTSDNGAQNPLEAASEAVRAAVRGASGEPAGDETS
jgi:ribonuclease E